MKIIEILTEGKMTKNQVKYQAEPKNNQRCINCTMWRDPDACSAVSGKISAQGWCNIFQGGAPGKRGNLVDK
jgi:hypothetical protein